MSRKTLMSTQSNSLPKSSDPACRTIVNQGMMRRFSSSSDLSGCSESSSEDVYLSANEDQIPNTMAPGYDRRNSKTSTRSHSPASAPRTRSKSAGPRESPKNLAKTSPASLGGTLSTNLQKQSSRNNSLSKSLNFGSGELKQNLINNSANRKAIMTNKLLPDKPKLFQRSVSTTATCLGNNDGQHRPIICGKDRNRLSSSTKSLSTSFDELPEPQGDADLFEHMELLFEEYRKLELGLRRKVSENTEPEAVSNQVQAKMAETTEKTRSRGRQLNRETVQASNSRRASPSPSQTKENRTASRPHTPTTKSCQPEKTKSVKTATTNQDSAPIYIKSAQSRGRASPSPNRTQTKNSNSSTLSSIATSQVDRQRDWSASSRSYQQNVAPPSPRGRPSSAQQLSASSGRGRTPSPSRSSVKGTSAKTQTVTTSTKGSSRTASSESLHESASASTATPVRSCKTTGRSSPSPDRNAKYNINKSSALDSMTSIEVASDTPLKPMKVCATEAANDTYKKTSGASMNSPRTSKLKGTNSHVPDASLKMKSNSRSNLRRSFECLSNQPKQEAEDLATTTSTSKTAASMEIQSPIEVPAQTLSVPQSSCLISSLSGSKHTNNYPNKSVVNEIHEQKSRLNRPSSATRNSRPATPSFRNPDRRTNAVKSESTGSESVSNDQHPKPLRSGTTIDGTLIAKSHNDISKQLTAMAGVKSSSIPSSPRGRAPDGTSNKVAPSATRRSASLQRNTSSTGSAKNISVSTNLQKPARPLCVKSSSSVCVNKTSDEISQVTNKYMSGSHPELQTSGQARPKLSRMNAVKSPYYSQENILSDLVPMQTNRKCQSSQDMFPSPRTTQPHFKTSEAQTEDKGAQTVNLTKTTDPFASILSEDQIRATTRRNDRGGRRTRIPQPIGRGTNIKRFNADPLKRCDSGVEISSMSPTESNANPDENWLDQNVHDFDLMNTCDSDDEYY